ncbi:flagellar biosynthesis protein FlgL [Sulfuricurvum sp.]|uniref:flagellin N-terminal helical domain-containing protein n=1 Tax=Sulfuricurvum sp. TaxID=2025608 RepID=UPI002D441568|nr:flagellar biosynthesis protein FlgL [Sulfuricurvum sp.]HZF69932.1 flagellar biosynthesis protein FlgL [Sulfuricurvum sp.]
MRITAGSYYNNIYGENNKLNQQLFDVNKQISSGMKIQYSYENPGVAIDTLRLDNEITTLTQVKTSAQSAYKISTQTDTTIGEIVKTIESMKVKMINAANDANSDTSTQAIAKELRGLQNHLLTLANTSIGGQYLFSGTATSVKPIDANGMYQGNDQNLEAFLGSGVKQKYNISGSQLFLGSENQVNRMVTSNVPQKSLTDLYPDIMKDPGMSRSDSKETYITGSSTIRDLMGDTDSITTNDAAHPSYFYLQGTRTDGSTFKSKIQMNMTDTMDDLTHKIALAYDPNQTNPTANQVNVTINANGQIEVSDKSAGSSKLDFHLVGAVDFSGGAAADVTNIDNLQSGTTDFETAAVTTPGLYIKEFTKSGYTTPTGTPNTIEGINYDRTNFTQDGAVLTSNVPQILNSDNSFATDSTRLGAVASGTTYDSVNDRYSGLNGKTLNLVGKDINGNAYDITVQLLDAGSTVTINSANGATAGDTFTIEDPTGAATDAGKVTYKQITDILNMAVTNQLPSSTAAVAPLDAYNTALTNANKLGTSSLNNGKITFEDKTNASTQASIALYDSTSHTYPASGTITSGSALSFNANSALQVRDPKNDFFAQIEEMIQSVEAGKKRSDGTTSTGQRNIGIQNSIQMLDDLSDHVSRLQTEAGSYSQVLQASSDRTDMLIISTKTLQSDVIDTDIAEATLKMQQLSLNYQALLSNISKVSKLSLVNYL